MSVADGSLCDGVAMAPIVPALPAAAAAFVPSQPLLASVSHTPSSVSTLQLPSTPSAAVATLGGAHRGRIVRRPSLLHKSSVSALLYDSSASRRSLRRSSTELFAQLLAASPNVLTNDPVTPLPHIPLEVRSTRASRGLGSVRIGAVSTTQNALSPMVGVRRVNAPISPAATSDANTSVAGANSSSTSSTSSPEPPKRRRRLRDFIPCLGGEDGALGTYVRCTLLPQGIGELTEVLPNGGPNLKWKRSQKMRLRYEPANSSQPEAEITVRPSRRSGRTGSMESLSGVSSRLNTTAADAISDAQPAGNPNRVVLLNEVASISSRRDSLPFFRPRSPRPASPSFAASPPPPDANTLHSIQERMGDSAHGTPQLSSTVAPRSLPLHVQLAVRDSGDYEPHSGEAQPLFSLLNPAQPPRPVSSTIIGGTRTPSPAFAARQSDGTVPPSSLLSEPCATSICSTASPTPAGSAQHARHTSESSSPGMAGRPEGPAPTGVRFNLSSLLPVSVRESSDEHATHSATPVPGQGAQSAASPSAPIAALSPSASPSLPLPSPSSPTNPGLDLAPSSLVVPTAASTSATSPRVELLVEVICISPDRDSLEADVEQDRLVSSGLVDLSPLLADAALARRAGRVAGPVHTRLALQDVEVGDEESHANLAIHFLPDALDPHAGTFLVTVQSVHCMRDPFLTRDESPMDWAVMRRLLLAVLLYFAVGVIFYMRVEHWSFLNALYNHRVDSQLNNQRIYGDLFPTSDGSRVFTIFFVLVGIGLIAVAVGIAGGLMLERQEQLMYRQLLAEKEANAAREAGLKPHKPLLSDTSRRLLWSFFLINIVVWCGAVGFYYLEENMPFLDAVYLCVITMSTVGYGEPGLSPKTVGSRAFCCPWIVISAFIVTRAIGDATDIYMSWSRRSRAQAILRNSIQSVEDLAAIDDNSDGAVSELEFLKHMLVKTNACKQRDIDAILQQFASLDVDKSGALDAEDFRRMEQDRLTRRMPTQVHQPNIN